MLEYFKRKIGEKLPVKHTHPYLYQVEPISITEERVTFDVFSVRRSEILIYGEHATYEYLGVKSLHPLEFEEGAYETITKVAIVTQTQIEKEENGN